MPRPIQKTVSKSLRLTTEQWRRFQPLTKALGFEIPFTEVVTEALDRLLDERGIKPPPSSVPEPFRLPLFSDEPILEDPPAEDDGVSTPADPVKLGYTDFGSSLVEPADSSTSAATSPATAASSPTRSKKKAATSPATAASSTSSTRSKKPSKKAGGK